MLPGCRRSVEIGKATDPKMRNNAHCSSMRMHETIQREMRPALPCAPTSPQTQTIQLAVSAAVRGAPSSTLMVWYPSISMRYGGECGDGSTRASFCRQSGAAREPQRIQPDEHLMTKGSNEGWKPGREVNPGNLCRKTRGSRSAPIEFRKTLPAESGRKKSASPGGRL